MEGFSSCFKYFFPPHAKKKYGLHKQITTTMTLNRKEIEIDIDTYHDSKKPFFLMCRLVIAGCVVACSAMQSSLLSGNMGQ